MLLTLMVAESDAPPPPPLEVAKCLPTKAAAESQIEFAEKFREGYDPEWHGHGLICWNLWYWKQVIYIHDERNSESQRRHYLRELIYWIGWERVLRGDIPPAVPL